MFYDDEPATGGMTDGGATTEDTSAEEKAEDGEKTSEDEQM